MMLISMPNYIVIYTLQQLSVHQTGTMVAAVVPDVPIENMLLASYVDILCLCTNNLTIIS